MTEKQKLSRLRITHARVGALILVVACTEMKSCCFEETSRGFGEPPITAVVTQHNDNARTGANLGILGLTVTSVSSGQFQRIFSFPVVGQIYAQPLYIPAVKDPAGVERNLLVVATMQNMLYVFDADAAVHKTGATATPLMSVPLGPPVPFNYMPMAEATFMVGSTPITWMIPSGEVNNPAKYNIYPAIGVTSTPVVDTTTMRLYVVAKVLAAGGGVAFQLWCFDLRTRMVVAPSPVTIAASVQGTSGTGGMVSFDPMFQHQRAGLLLANGSLYIGFGSHQDTPPYHGWLLRYDAASLQQIGAWCSTPDGTGGAIWQAGSGPAADDLGRIYVITANGFVRGDVTTLPNHAQSFVQLSPSPGPLGWYTPADAVAKSAVDADLGSSGPVLMPGTKMVIGVGKDGILYLLDRDNALGMQQAFQAAKSPDLINPQGLGFHHVHGTPVVWRNLPSQLLVYLWPERDKLRTFRYLDASAVFDPAQPIKMSTFHSPLGVGLVPISMPGGILSLSANGKSHGSGLVWASLPTTEDALTHIVPGMLRIFDAEDATKELWDSEQNPGRDRVGLFAKYTPPTVADDRVYLATFSDRIDVYGLRQWATYVWQGGGLPSRVPSGKPFHVAIEMRNSGSTTWITSGGYHLGSQTPQDNMTWGARRFDLPHDVAPGSRVIIDMSLVAPKLTGTSSQSFDFQWQMVQDGVEWFGDFSPKVRITVVP